MFADGFIQALNSDAADLDKNKRTSMWEAFFFASRIPKQHFEQKGLMSTEKALLEDNEGRRQGGHVGDRGGRTLATMTYWTRWWNRNRPTPRCRCSSRNRNC